MQNTTIENNRTTPGVENQESVVGGGSPRGSLSESQNPGVGVARQAPAFGSDTSAGHAHGNVGDSEQILKVNGPLVENNEHTIAVEEISVSTLHFRHVDTSAYQQRLTKSVSDTCLDAPHHHRLPAKNYKKRAKSADGRLESGTWSAFGKAPPPAPAICKKTTSGEIPVLQIRLPLSTLSSNAVSDSCLYVAHRLRHWPPETIKRTESADGRLEGACIAFEKRWLFIPSARSPEPLQPSPPVEPSTAPQPPPLVEPSTAPEPPPPIEPSPAPAEQPPAPPPQRRRRSLLRRLGRQLFKAGRSLCFCGRLSDFE